MLVKQFDDNTINFLKAQESIYLYGAGHWGAIIVKFCVENDIALDGIFVSDVDANIDYIYGVPVLAIGKNIRLDACILICIKGDDAKEIQTNLIQNGFVDVHLINDIPKGYEGYEWNQRLDEKWYPDELKLNFWERFRKKLNLNNPQTYNEKIQRMKIYEATEKKTRLADKVLVREWVKDTIGEEYLTHWHGIWDDAQEIDFEKLPEKFALKVNNGSERNIIVKDKSQIDEEVVKKQLNKWKTDNYAYYGLEMQYKNITPKILCEEYIEGLAETLYDYDIYCFHGKPCFIHCIKNSHREGWCGAFYSLEWERLPFDYVCSGCGKDIEPAPRPHNLEKMVEISERLCQGFEHVRVDLYNAPDGRLLFSEMTFTPWSGMSVFEPEEYNEIIGQMV